MAQDTLVTGSKLTAIANAIRTKGGTSAQITLDQMPAAVAAIPSGGGGGFDASQITGSISFYTPMTQTGGLDMSGLDTSNLTTMYQMFAFSRCNPIDVTSFNTSSVQKFTEMFYECANLTSMDVSNFDTSHATLIKGMFRNCPLLRSVNFANLDTTNITTAASVQNLFYSDNNLQAVIWATNKTTVQAFPSALNDTSILPSSAHLYVPDNLVTAYQTATNYSVISSRIHGISDLPQEFKTLYGIS